MPYGCEQLRILRRRDLGQPGSQLGDGRLEDVLDPLGQGEFHVLANGFRQLAEVFLVGAWE